MFKHFMKNNLPPFCRNAKKNQQAGATKWLAAALLAMPASVVFAEGTKQVSPNVNNISALAILPNQLRGPYLSNDAGIVAQRLRVRITNTSEKIYCGFHWRNYSSAAVLTDVWMRIYDPSGNEVARHRLRDGNAGWIPASTMADGYARAVNGPNGVDGVTNGYTPYVFSPTSAGEYSIVLYQATTATATTGDAMVTGSTWQKAPFWDITVANTTLPVGQQTQNGRLFSYNWSLVANSDFGNATATAKAAPTFFAYSHDSTLVKVEFGQDENGDGGFMPIAYNIGFTHYGIYENQPWEQSRKSVPSATNVAITNGYRVFLNQPSDTLYPIKEISENPKMAAVPITGCPGGNLTAHFALPEAGDVRLLFDIDGNGDGYTPGTRDFVLEAFDLPAGPNTITWNGRDGLGNYLVNGATMHIQATYRRGRFNLPIYDAEVNLFGMYVETIAPTFAPSNRLYWDDASLVAATGTCNTQNAQINVTAGGWNNSWFGTVSSKTNPTRAWAYNGNPTNVVPAPTQNNTHINELQCDDYGNVRMLNTWAWALEANSDVVVINLGCYDISGTVMHDPNGAVNGLVDMSATAAAIPANLYAYLVNPEDNTVLAITNVDGVTGAYNFSSRPAGNYKVVISEKVKNTGDVVVGNTSLSGGWEFVSEQIGTSPFVNLDTDIDAAQSFTLGGNLSNVNFGIQLPPAAESSSYTINTPTGGAIIPLDGSLIAQDGPVLGTVQDDVDGSVVTVIIESLPETNVPQAGNEPQLYYKGVLITSAGTQLGSISEPFDPSMLSIELRGSGYTAVSFTFFAKDEAGATSNVATYTLMWASPVPVNFLSFDAAVVGNEVVLHWATGVEVDNKGYVVERSANGKNWTALAALNAATEPALVNNYDYTDRKPLAGKSMYRIKQEDVNGSAQYSNVKAVTMSALVDVSVHPNPTKQYLSLTRLPAGASVKVTDVNGVVVYSSQVMTTEMHIDLKNQPTGVYLVQVWLQDQEMAQIKVVKE